MSTIIEVRVECVLTGDGTYTHRARVQNWEYNEDMLAYYEKYDVKDLLPILIRELSHALNDHTI